MILLTTSVPAFASNESNSEKVGTGFIVGLIMTIGVLLFNWLKSQTNKKDDK